MTTRQAQKYKRNGILISFFNKATLEVREGIPRFDMVFGEFKRVQKVLTGLQVQQSRGSGSSFQKDKAEARRGMIERTLDVAAKVINYAQNVRDRELYGAVNYKRRDLVLFSEEDCLEVCRVVYGRALGIVGKLAGYGVDRERLAELLESIEDFKAAMPEPKEAIESRAKATREIASCFREADLLLKRLDEMVLMMRLDVPEFYRGFVAVRKLRKPGFRKLSGQGRVVDGDGNGLGGVVMSCEALGIRKRLNDSGRFRLKRVKAGEYEFLFEKEGFVSVRVRVYINKGRRAEVEVVMETELF